MATDNHFLLGAAAGALVAAIGAGVAALLTRQTAAQPVPRRAPTSAEQPELLAAYNAAMKERKLAGRCSPSAHNGVAFYATRNTDSHFCFALVRGDGQLEKVVRCEPNADNFLSAKVQALTFPDAARDPGSKRACGAF